MFICMAFFDRIGEKLSRDGSLSLSLKYENMAHSRCAYLMGPNPREGKLAGEGDQTWVEGKRASVWDYSFAGRDAIEALGLLEAKCSGDGDAASTVRCQLMGVPSGRDEASEDPRGGLDNWMVAGFYIDVVAQGKDFITFVYAVPFGFGSRLISSSRGQTVGESLAPYVNFSQSMDALGHVHRGAKIQAELTGGAYSMFVRPEKEIACLGRGAVPGYSSAVKSFGSVDITTDAKNFLHVSMLMDEFYDSSEK